MKAPHRKKTRPEIGAGLSEANTAAAGNGTAIRIPGDINCYIIKPRAGCEAYVTAAGDIAIKQDESDLVILHPDEAMDLAAVLPVLAANAERRGE